MARRHWVVFTLIFLAGAGVVAGRYWPQLRAAVPTAVGDRLMVESRSRSSDLTPAQASPSPHPISIDALRQQRYPGSALAVERELSPGRNYRQYVTSYQSEGLQIYALLTIPNGTPPAGSWPGIVFNHGYIPPEQYRTTERYDDYVAGFANQGFAVLKPDYRGHGQSEGQPTGAYFSPGYTVDVLNAAASLRQWPEINPDRIGMWGHSMGGHLALRAVAVDPQLKAVVIWGGVVADYPDFFQNWNQRRPWQPSAREQSANRPNRAQLTAQYDTPDQGNPFWQQISPWAKLDELETPIQLHHARGDEKVPWQFSQALADRLTLLNKPVELYLYEGSNHNLSGAAFSPAMRRSVEFFQTHLAPAAASPN